MVFPLLKMHRLGRKAVIYWAMAAANAHGNGRGDGLIDIVLGAFDRSL
jgi:hypothetical protein